MQQLKQSKTKPKIVMSITRITFAKFGITAEEELTTEQKRQLKGEIIS